MIDYAPLDRRPVIVAVAGPNGAGKSTFYQAHLRPAALRFVNADVMAQELELDALRAQRLAASLREALLKRRESFVFETVFSDPVGDKLRFLEKARRVGYTVVLCYIGLSSPEASEARVAMRVSQGGHDIPSDKLYARYPRTLSNLASAIRRLPHVLVHDNDDLTTPFRLVAVFENGQLRKSSPPLPSWLPQEEA